MSVQKVAEAITESIKSNKYHFILANLAPPDMVGHTGNYAATIQAVEATDAAINNIYKCCKENNYNLLITADHGNAEKMTGEGGVVHTAHTCAKVPFIVCSNENENVNLSECKKLGDIAKVVLSIMGLPIPLEMY